MKNKALHRYFLLLILTYCHFGFTQDNATLNLTTKNTSVSNKNLFNSLGDEFLYSAETFKTKGLYDSSLIYLDSAEYFFNNYPDSIYKEALVLLNKGRIYNKLNQPIQSINYLKESYVIFNQLKDTLNIANVELNFGNVFKHIKKHNLAKQHYFKALNLFSELDNKKRIGSCYNNLGNLFTKLTLYDSAKVYYLKSVEIRKTDDLYKSYAYHNLANLYVHTLQFDSALYYVNKSLNIKYKINNEKEINSDYLTLGEIYYNLKDYKNANYYLTKALNSSDDIYFKYEVEKVLSKNYLEQNNYKLASLHFNNYFNYNDYINKINSSKELEKQLIEFEFTKDSLENQQLLLKKEISDIENKNLKLKEKYKQTKIKYILIILAIIIMAGILLYILFRRRLKEEKEHKAKLELQNEELKRTLISNEEKEVLLKEIHHRVKNNLQIINSLIRLQSHYMTPNNYLTKLSETENRIGSMALVHEKLYQSDELSKLNVKSYIMELVSNIYESYQTGVPIEFKYEISDLKYSIDSLIPIGLIINEVVSNSLKYAFQGKESGEIYIKFCSECMDNQTVLIIRDNGIGADLQFEELSADSLGMELIDSLTEQLDGKLELNTDNGFSYFFTFPTLK